MIFIKIVPLVSALGKTTWSVPSIFRVVLGSVKKKTIVSKKNVKDVLSDLKCLKINVEYFYTLLIKPKLQ